MNDHQRLIVSLYESIVSKQLGRMRPEPREEHACYVLAIRRVYETELNRHRDLYGKETENE